jgi:hypothetical protein
MWHAADQFGKGGYKPVASDRINPDWVGDDVADLGAIMTEKPNYAAIGAVGPDLFFFLPDFRDIRLNNCDPNAPRIPTSSVLITVLDFLEEIYDAVDPYIGKWEHFLGPISEDTAEEMSRLTGGLTETVGDISGELSGILTTLLEDLVVTQIELWDKFSLGLNKGYDDQSYLWSDMLHYRSTGQFGQQLWLNAREDKNQGLWAYALGYLTHIATDVTAHAQVNAISGGPFRTHWQRHHLVENHMDAYWYLLDEVSQAPRTMAGYRQFTESALYFDIGFDDKNDNGPIMRPSTLPSGRTLRDNWTRKRMLDKDSKLPDEVAELLLKTITDVFYPPSTHAHPKILRTDVNGPMEGLPTIDMIKEAYDLFWQYLKLSTTDGLAHEPPSPPPLFPNLDFPTITDPGDGLDDNDGDFWKDVLDVILAIICVLAFIVEVAIYLATVIPAMALDLATYPGRVTAYYTVELPLYQMLKSFRMVLVMTGYLHPMSDEISQALVRVGNPMPGTFQQVLDELGDTFGGMLPEKPQGDTSGDPWMDPDNKYPRQHPVDEFRKPWNYPATELELCPTVVGPAAQNAGPKTLFSETLPDPEIRDGLECARSPAAADTVGGKLTTTKHMGDSVSFSKYMIWLATRSDLPGSGVDIGDFTHVHTTGPGLQGCAPGLVDWNLDSDRGYGYHCWDWNRRSDGSEHADPNTHMFKDPCTWPPQTEADCNMTTPAYDSTKPLLLHFVSEDDPGCDVDPDCFKATAG